MRPVAVILALLIASTGFSCGKSGNVLLSEFSGLYGGVPQFDAMRIADLQPALETAMAIKLAEVESIANNPEAPSFENTIAAFERSGRELHQVLVYRGIWRSNASTPEFRAVDQELTTRLAAFNSQLIQNDALFQRIRQVYNSKESKSLSADKQRLVWLIYDSFASDGATLQGEAKDRYAAINLRLAELQNQFGNNVLADEEGYVTYVAATQLSGLPQSFVAAAAAAANEREHAGEYAITNTRSSIDPFLTFSDERAFARAGVAHVHESRRQRRRTRQQRDHRGDRAAAR